MGFINQTRTLTKKDLLILVRHKWIGTFIQALAFPVVFTLIVSYISVWTRSGGHYGIGEPSNFISFSDALAQTTDRSRVVIIHNNLTGRDVSSVVSNLTSQIHSSGKDLHVVADPFELATLCPSSNAGVSDCWGAVEFVSSVDSGGNWTYTIYQDSSVQGGIDVTSKSNPVQLYTFPLQHAIVSAIAATGNGPQVPDNILQYPFTGVTEIEKEQNDASTWQFDIEYFLAFVFFIGMSGITYHCVGHVVVQREKGLLALIDAMMPNSRRWQCFATRTLATHIAFDLVYLPGWIIMGGIMSAITFPDSSTGILIGLHILAGLALTSYSLLTSSLFKRAQLSSICAIVAAIVFAIVAQLGEGVNIYSNLAGVLATAVLFPPSTYVYFLISTASFEEAGATGNSLGGSVKLDDTAPTIRTWKVTPGTFLGLFAFQIILYPILGIIIEKYLHGTSSKSRHMLVGEDVNDVAISLQGFSKTYRSLTDKKQKVNAVDDLTLDFHEGAINVLLGSNGSGKTTTLSAIAGLETISKGSIQVNTTGGLGLCPQKNILWDEMTVLEHVSFFDSLKNTRNQSRIAHKREVQRLIDGCDLRNKAFARSKTLSGGQKRKLQLAMAFAGGSNVCCIDEASSGIDPLARRRIWDILLAERGARTLLFTTHFLDEAEALADHVAILSKGKLMANGTVASLKNDHGGGYQVTLNTGEPELAGLREFSHRTDYDQHVFDLPDSSTVAALCAALERQHLHDYRLSGPTIERVFLKLAAEMKADSGIARELRSDTVKDATIEVTRVSLNDKALTLNSGIGCGPLKQTWIMFLKRFTILKHNFMPYVCAMFLALVVAGMVTRLFNDPAYRNGIPCTDPSQRNTLVYGSASSRFDLSPSTLSDGLVYGPKGPDGISVADLQHAVPNNTYDVQYYDYPTDFNDIASVGSLQQFTNYINNNSSETWTGGLYNDQGQYTMAWYAASWYGSYTPALLQNLMFNLITNITIDAGMASFAESYIPDNGSTSLVAAFVTLGFAIYPALFALYPTAERLRMVRAMEYSNGIYSSSLWLAYVLFDLIFILIISVFTVVIWSTTWAGWYGLGYMFPVLVLYGLAATVFSYVVSLFVSSQLAAFAFSAVIQVVMSMLVFVGYFITSSQAPVTRVYHWFDYMQYTVGIISPASWLVKSLFVAMNDFSLACDGDSLAAYPGRIDLYGGPILYLTLQLIALSAFLMYWESGRSLEVFGIAGRTRELSLDSDPEKDGLHKRGQGTDAEESLSRLSPENKGLRVYNVSKSFGSNHAVQDATFGILPSERFALLGPNGAGKSTMISLIRGDLSPAHKADSSIHIANDSLHDEPMAAKNHLGVCPQFDSVDTMTLNEHLHFYARARGVPDRESNINQLIAHLGLEEHRYKLCKKLSGGTLRKLSLAIALISNPGVLLLDEPSSGMDAAAKRALWSTLSSIAAGRVLLITTHSMEEADALCDRAGIMAGKMLALGSIDELRAKHGNAAFVHLVHKDAPHSSVEETEDMRQWALRAFPGATVDSKTFGGQLRFSVPKTDAAGGGQRDVDIGRMFRTIEAARANLGISDYSVGPATLDQVFMNVVRKHDVQEENAKSSQGGVVSRLWRR
ncbi:ABC transporter [Polychaeton citri CBS 116435]|uniref:ABC transporter n=1 Tax=Polychaeton citri CBS 116435 TaxID=1314669 RepID=A0A9P4QG80_9PEZI|nr:ABC transporter [Polychaeton citri CBS 116435]